MVDTCISNNGRPSEFSLFSIINIISIIIFTFCRFYIEYIEEYIKSDTIKFPSYGIGASQFVKLICGLGFARIFFNIVLFFIFLNSNDTNSHEFACQISSDLIGLILPFLFIYFVLMILGTNWLRVIWTRHKFSKLILSNIVSITSPFLEDEEIKVVILSVARGTWVPPIIHDLKKQFPMKSVKVFCVDAFETKYFKDSTNWLESNMKLENCFDNIEILWTDFEHLPLITNSIDFVVLPVGNVMIYMTESPEDEINIAKTVHLMDEIYRILKYNGQFYASNLILLQSKWINAIEKSKFHLNHNTISSLIFWSYIPAKITVATKKFETILPIVENNRVIEVTKPIELHIAKHLRHFGWFPNGFHWRLIELLMLFTCIVWIGYVVVTWYFLSNLQVPTNLPYNQMISSLFISNALMLPFVFFIILGRLRTEAILQEHEFFHFDSKFIQKQIMKVYLMNMVDVFLLLTLNSALGWLPYFGLDLLILNSSNISLNKLNKINQVFYFQIKPLLIKCVVYLLY